MQTESFDFACCEDAMADKRVSLVWGTNGEMEGEKQLAVCFEARGYQHTIQIVGESSDTLPVVIIHSPHFVEIQGRLGLYIGKPLDPEAWSKSPCSVRIHLPTIFDRVYRTSPVATILLLNAWCYAHSYDLQDMDEDIAVVHVAGQNCPVKTRSQNSLHYLGIKREESLPTKFVPYYYYEDDEVLNSRIKGLLDELAAASLIDKSAPSPRLDFRETASTFATLSTAESNWSVEAEDGSGGDGKDAAEEEKKEPESEERVQGGLKECEERITQTRKDIWMKRMKEPDVPIRDMLRQYHRYLCDWRMELELKREPRRG